MMEDENCVFCKIVDKKIPSYQIYEDELFFSFLDVRPLNAGHVLIIPKKHYRWVWDVQEEYSSVVNKIANILKKALETDYVQSIVMGDEVPHAHIHLIPRFENDGHGGLVDIKNVKEIPEAQMKEIADKIKKSF